MSNVYIYIYIYIYVYKIALLFICIIHVLSVHTLCISFNYSCMHGYGQFRNKLLLLVFYFIAKSYTYQKYGIQHRYTIIIIII